MLKVLQVKIQKKKKKEAIGLGIRNMPSSTNREQDSTDRDSGSTEF